MEASGSRRSAPAERAGTSSPEPPTIISGSSSAEAGSSSARRRSAIPSLPEPGDRIDVFELEESIGVGGMGAVFRALDAKLERHVALKILPPSQSGDSEVIQRFYQEARAAAKLDHENIARVYTVGCDGRYHYIAFEFIEGMTIRQRVLERGPLPVGEAINYTLQIAGALVHAAERGVVHRDIKPSNIIVTPQGRAKLVDMGLARHFERGGSDDGLTQSGMTLGTFDYISPEQARDPRDVDVRSDLYSLGCTLFHMLT
ncbi:MAG: serine/threonine protein kinase, partial [Isosphaeraceae bacterium]|nr:serine/threonine protein kinase [Isosphaeraceae bacterium]